MKEEKSKLQAYKTLRNHFQFDDNKMIQFIFVLGEELKGVSFEDPERISFWECCILLQREYPLIFEKLGVPKNYYAKAILDYMEEEER